MKRRRKGTVRVERECIPTIPSIFLPPFIPLRLSAYGMVPPTFQGSPHSPRHTGMLSPSSALVSLV